MAELLKKDGVKFKIIIAGEGELRSELTNSIKAKGLENEVALLGHVDDMPAFFNSLDVFVFTSLYEGSANTLIETLQYGVPCVAWDVSSNPEVIEDGKTGVLVKFPDVQEFQKAMTELWNNKDKVAQIKIKSADIIQNRFDTQKNLQILDGIVRD
jgi:glycosyltransferase involved in cell wall biosynthesis